MAPRTLGGCAYFGPTQTFVDMFQCKDGKSITESSLYDWQNPWQTGTLVWIFSVCDLVHAYSI